MSEFNISLPEEWKPVDDYSSHRPLLYLAINTIDHSQFFEFGMGNGSTPLLAHWYSENNKELYSFENNREWFDVLTAGYLNGYRANSRIYRHHMAIYSEDLLPWQVPSGGILFIDSAPGEQRKELIARHRGNAQCIIVHDTEPGAEYVYGMNDELCSFPYRVDLVIPGMPHTTAVSDNYNVTAWEGAKIGDYILT